ncbi:hypothetical protein E2C01_033126 [Portunus trituberculatus]|uniref:Uncharacterized protein n=1 Tax=Portunus trituberculatus TaxID=210409 RepID=A0A5B7F1L6_PORTR|nr:hypothetical protein [Portunus trituberculatus]
MTTPRQNTRRPAAPPPCRPASPSQTHQVGPGTQDRPLENPQPRGDNAVRPGGGMLHSDTLLTPIDHCHDPMLDRRRH